MDRVARIGLVILALIGSACNNNSDTTLAPTPDTVTDVLTGVLPAAVNGVGQSVFVTFEVKASGVGSITLTSAVETLANGVNPTVVIGLALGTVSNNSCVTTTNTILSQASTQPFSTPTLTIGTNCILVSDQTVQSGPVNFTLQVVHP